MRFCRQIGRSHLYAKSAPGEEMTENLRFVFVELETFRKSESELRGMLDKWMYVLKNLSRLIDRPAGSAVRAICFRVLLLVFSE